MSTLPIVEGKLGYTATGGVAHYIVEVGTGRFATKCANARVVEFVDEDFLVWGDRGCFRCGVPTPRNPEHQRVTEMGTLTKEELANIGDLVRQQASWWHKIYTSGLVNTDTRMKAKTELDMWLALYSKVRLAEEEAE